MVTLFRAVIRIELLSKVLLQAHHKHFIPVLKQQILDQSSSTDDLDSDPDQTKIDQIINEESKTRTYLGHIFKQKGRTRTDDIVGDQFFHTKRSQSVNNSAKQGRLSMVGYATTTGASITQNTESSKPPPPNYGVN